MFFSKKIIGIDIGVGSIKIVELSGSKKNKKLLNYAELKTDAVSGGQKIPSSQLSNNDAANVIRAMLQEAKIKTKEVIFSIPDFSTFFTSFDIPQMTPEEIPGAVQYSASQFVTLPMSEITLDWQVMQKAPNDKSSQIKVFLVAVPNKLVSDYQAIAKLAGLDLYALEAEVFGITRALIKDNKKTICLIDMGAETSTINIVDGGYLRKSYSFVFSSNKLTNSISSLLKLDKNRAEELKIKDGLLSKDSNVVSTISSALDPLVMEMRAVIDEFKQKENKVIEEIYLTGGSANLPGLKEYVKGKLGKEPFIPNCFIDIDCPAGLQKNIVEMAPRFSAAVGVALYRFEN